MARRTSTLLSAIVLACLALAIALPGRAAARPAGDALSGGERATLLRYAADTWQSFVAMTDPATGLPADNIDATTKTRAAYTSPTNIAAYIWATLAARDLQIIQPSDARARIAQTLDTLSRLERDHGFYFNWYDPATGAKLTTWPANGSPVRPFLSTVDNGWLAAALIMVANSVPQLRGQAEALLEPMDFGFFENPANGLLKGGYWPDAGDCGGFTCFDYGTLNTEPRIAEYIGIARGQLPAADYFKMWRTFPSSCDWSWQEMQPSGVTRTYLGVDVYEGHYTYRGMNIVPSWGGSMFEALMVPLFVPEAEWGPRSWGVNHPLYVQAQIQHGLDEAGYGYWGFSPSSDPSVADGYREYGVDPIGMNPDGYYSDEQKTPVDYGFDQCPGRETTSIPTSYGDGVVTPHAAFLALQFAPDAALDNLAKLRRNFDAYGWGGFYDAVDVGTGQVARRYLALDQGMIMVALGNALRNDRMQHYFTRGAVEQAIKPLLALEEFTAGP